jgi:hypothetical protein
MRFHTLENTGTEDVTAVLVELNRSNEAATISLSSKCLTAKFD